MSDETNVPETEEFAVVLPPNARLSGLRFDDNAHSVRVSFSDGGADRDVPAEQIITLHGARIRHEKIIRTPKKVRGAIPPAPGASGTTTAVGDERVSTSEEFHFVLALRATGVGEVWYLAADSFNFRHALGEEAGYSTEINFRAFVRRLGRFAPRATQDAFFAAILGGLPLPPPLGSLIEFLRVAAVGL